MNHTTEAARHAIRAELVNNIGEGSDEWAKRMHGKHLEPGVVTYDNDDGTKKTYLLTREAIARMRPTAEGKPIVGKAGGFDHMPVNPKDAAKGKYDGEVFESHDGNDGWEWIWFLVRDPETKEKCRQGYQLSCAYVPTETDGKSGLWHNVPYDEEILNGEYTHFAVVPNPRYNGAEILVNSLKKGGIVEKMLKTLLNCIPLPQLKALVNSIEEDEKKKADAEKAAADKANTMAANAAPPDPAIEGPAVINKEQQPEPGTEAAAKNDGDAPPARPEPGTPGASGAVPPASEKTPINAENAPVAASEPPVEPVPGKEPPAANVEPAKSPVEDPVVVPGAEKGNKTDEEKAAKEAAKAAEDAAKAAEKANAAEAELARMFDEIFTGPNWDEDMMRTLGLGDVAAAELDKPGLKPWARQDARTKQIFKVAYEDAHGKNSLENSLKGTRERRNTLMKARQERFNALRAAIAKKQERLNALKVAAQKEREREERFNSLRQAAEDRGGAVVSPHTGVVSPDDKQDLGQARYGS